MPIPQPSFRNIATHDQERSLEDRLKDAVLSQDWPATLNLLQTYDFDIYPGSTLCHVIRNADRNTRSELFESFFKITEIHLMKKRSARLCLLPQHMIIQMLSSS